MLSNVVVDDSNIIGRKIERCNDSDKFNVVASACNGAQPFLAMRAALLGTSL